ncbi:MULTISPECIES: glycoside hydrolase family 19 protein [unclassified Herbaspirillum]|uniref:glycoside hydrolase family 19 protein n=1 Tax=unclassified Herbaspirillum TaxID=2624150 RepID=UPI000C08F5FD|nr:MULTISPECIES: glycoside hydrolase family 19 protein [unclassified Herbaspirillum]MAF04965.1 chitinase [Herbaspirillum sp.]MBO18513.1 chitinase [Herbaspirillum sp.]|tara:strand:+ start:3923 stop:4435 length:513 start_codon:yes stop_codon:yes gene_type:complete
MTPDQLRKIMPQAGAKADVFAGPLTDAMAEFDISNKARQAAFIAQIGHESGQLRYVRELASGSAYEGRKDLGNTMAGDGVKYKGRGLIQITGKANYTALMMALGIDCLEHPEVVEEPTNACRSAAWFWHEKGLNALADQGNFLAITKRINGGTNGLEDRQVLWTKAKEVL